MPSKTKTSSKAKAAAPRHPYSFTLDLLELAIDRLPPTFSAKRAKVFSSALSTFRKVPSYPYEKIQAVITMLGKESWPYRKAYEEMYGQFGRSSEESFLLGHLDRGIREKYVRFINQGGKLSYVATVKTLEELRQPSPFERYFTPEEKFAIEQALFESRDAARAEINELVTNKKAEEYAALVAKYADRQKKMEAQVAEMRQLTGVSKKWSAEIADRIRTIEEGWSVVEQGTDLADLIQETEYWKGTLQSFLHS